MIESVDEQTTPMAPRPCFSLVESRRFGSPVAASTLALCPSMDLLTLALQPQQHHATGTATAPKTTSKISPLWLYRSLSFQKLATVVVASNDDDDENDNDNKEEEDDNKEDPKQKQHYDESSNTDTTQTNNSPVLSAVWRPDGRWLAATDCSNKGRLTLYHVEALVKETNLSPSNLFSSSLATASSSFPTLSPFQVTMAGNVVQIPIGTTAAAQVSGLIWSHVGQWHPKLTERADMGPDEEEEEDEDNYTNVPSLFSKIRQRYADRNTALLPASEYHSEHATAVPSSQTPLSVLVLAKTNGTLDCFLNGRYRIASDVPFFAPTTTNTQDGCGCWRAQIACSNDLSHLLVVAQNDKSNRDNHTTTQEQPDAASTTSCGFSLLTIPALAEQRYTLQSLTALYSSIMGHFHALPSLLTEVLEAYKSSLKPLDAKLEGLVRLFRNYGLLPSSSSSASSTQSTAATIRQHLVRYILSGHTAGSADLSNAMDQFFTGPQMNDQIVQRMERSLTVAMANVESMLRKTMAAAESLVLESDELRGLARSSNELIPSEPAMELQEHCHALMIAMESSLTSLVDARFRLRDWIAWLRATGSQIKARGTAPNSVQRDNAKKRRVPDDTVRRILRYLQQEKHDPAFTGDPTKEGNCSLCESLLGIPLSQHWVTQRISEKTSQGARPGSPKSVATFAAPPSIPAAFQQALVTAQRLFDGPATALKPCIHRHDFELPVSTIENATAITTRLGAGGLNGEDLVYGESPPLGFFQPRLLQDEDVARPYRQWALSAQATEPGVVQIWAVPLSWHTFSLSHTWNDMDQQSGDFALYLQATLQFPTGYKVHELNFYIDDGKSALFSGSQNGTGMERRQALTALVSRDGVNDEEDAVSVLELWSIRYERAFWYRGDLRHRQDGNSDIPKLSFDPISEATRTTLVALVGEDFDEEEEDMEEDGVLQTLSCKTRELSKLDSPSDGDLACLTLSGSRGIAAVTTKHGQNGSFLQIIDMEEDEETEEDEEMEEDE